MKTLMVALSVVMGLALLPRAGAGQNAAMVGEGAQLYGKNCVRCHSARSPMERTDREWVTIVNHMRARANLRKSEAQAMIAFLQAVNASEASGTAVASANETQDASASGAAPAPDVPSVGSGEGTGTAVTKATGPQLVLVDLADPDLSPEARRALARYLEVIPDR